MHRRGLIFATTIICFALPGAANAFFSFCFDGSPPEIPAPMRPTLYCRADTSESDLVLGTHLHMLTTMIPVINGRTLVRGIPRSKWWAYGATPRPYITYMVRTPQGPPPGFYWISSIFTGFNTNNIPTLTYQGPEPRLAGGSVGPL